MKFSKLVVAGCMYLAVMGVALAKSTVVQKPSSISLMVDGTFLIKENGEQVLVDGWKDLTGIDLVLNHPIHNEYYEKVNLAFTTGDIPDVVLLGSTQYSNFAVNGALYDMTKLFNNSPLKGNIKDMALVNALKIDGRLYGLPYDRGNGTVTYVRGDWLKKLGLKAPKNYAEFITMLRLFKNKNPDGLKPEDVIPITAAGLVGPEYPYDIYLREFYQDATPDFVKVNGKWVDGMSQPNMKAALKRLHDAYAEGLIDKEIITNKTSTCRDKFYAGKVGAFNYWAGTWNYNLQTNISPNHPDATVVPIPAIKETKYIERPSTAICITSKCKDPEAVFKYFFETILDCGSGQQFMTFGVKGKTYDIVNGQIQFMPSIQDPKKPFVKAWFSPEIPTTKYAANWKEDPLIKSSLELFQANSIVYPLPPLSETLSELAPELIKIKSSCITKIVYGSLSIDDGIAGYQKDSAKYVKAILADINKK
jgi:putative aldouronate transport system substrate-binding protein